MPSLPPPRIALTRLVASTKPSPSSKRRSSRSARSGSAGSARSRSKRSRSFPSIFAKRPSSRSPPELQKQGLLDDNGEVSKEAHGRLDWERELSLPTPGVVVKACLDGCEACEPELERSIRLDNDRKELENRLLARQIELLDKAQEYRCCPDDDDTPVAPA